MGAEIVDRFGPLPPEVELLMKLVAIKALCRRANVEKLDAGAEGRDARLPRQFLRQSGALVKWVDGSAARSRRCGPTCASSSSAISTRCRDRLEGHAEDHAGAREDRGKEGVGGDAFWIIVTTSNIDRVSYRRYKNAWIRGMKKAPDEDRPSRRRFSRRGKLDWARP